MEVGPPVRACRRTDQTAWMLLFSKEKGSERFRKRRRIYRHVRFEKLNESELTEEASKSWTMSKREVYMCLLSSAEETCKLTARHPALRQQEFKSGQFRERENLHSARQWSIGADVLVVVMKGL